MNWKNLGIQRLDLIPRAFMFYVVRLMKISLQLTASRKQYYRDKSSTTEVKEIKKN